mmetsp:Transcript_33434/g.88539  ORF Transcript_33434/g.88539 Transcript_33434/m.88539 type:complete len:353 (-) Transcript_33434:670-1728(-)
MPVRRVAVLLLEEGDPLRDCGVVRLLGPGVADVLRVGGLVRLEVLHQVDVLLLQRVQVGVIPELALDVVHPLLQRRVGVIARGCRLPPAHHLALQGRGARLPRRVHHLGVQLLDLRVGRRKLLRVLVRGVAHRVLEVVHSLDEAGVVRVAALHVQGELPMRALLALQGLGVLVGAVTDHLLDVREAFLQGGVVLEALPLLVLDVVARRALVLLARGALALELPVELVRFGVGRGDLLGVLVDRVAHHLLHVIEALLHRGVVSVGLLDGVQLLGMLAVSLLDRLQLLGVLVRRVVQQLLQVADALGRRRVVRVAGLGLGGQLGVARLQGLKVLRVLLGRVAEQALDVVHPLLH